MSGNVRSAAADSAALRAAQPLWRRLAAAVLPEALAQAVGVTVAIESSPASTETDNLGFFSLEGNQFGPNLIRFTATGVDATVPVTLPAGGELQLIDIDLQGSRATVGETRLTMSGPITGIDCQGSLLQVLSGERVAFRVRIDAGTVIVDQDGAALRCIDLAIGRVADVQGTVDPSGHVLAARIQENPAPGQEARSVEFLGSIRSVGCPTQLSVERDADAVEVQVQITASTTIRERGGDPLTCDDLAAGDDVDVQGEEDSFGVRALIVERQPAPSPTPTP